MTTGRHRDAEHVPHELQRKLSNRHLQLIAIGGAIGTGLFMGSGKRSRWQGLLFYIFT